MDVQKNKTLLIKGCLCMSLILSGCGGQSLSEREIVRGVLFAKQAESYSVCLVLADQNAEGAQPESNKVSAAQGMTPAQALERAEQALYGDVYYGLLDLAALPADTDWATASEIGELLYENAQPAPELSVFVLDDEPIASWAKQGATLYKNMKAVEDTYQVHCGLQQLFAQREVCAIPAYTAGGGYDFVLLLQYGEQIRCHGLAEAQLAAVLCGQADRLQGTFADGAATCEARAQVTVEGNKVQLHLRDASLSALGPSAPEDLENALQNELQDRFYALYETMQKSGADPFHLNFWQACTYGPGSVMEKPELELLLE